MMKKLATIGKEDDIDDGRTEFSTHCYPIPRRGDDDDNNNNNEEEEEDVIAHPQHGVAAA
jgi:hypothetical protein